MRSRRAGGLPQRSRRRARNGSAAERGVRLGRAEALKGGVAAGLAADRIGKRANKKTRRARGGRAVNKRSEQVRRWLSAGSAGVRVDRVTLLGGSRQSAPAPMHHCPTRASLRKAQEAQLSFCRASPIGSVTAWHRRRSGCRSTVPTPAPNCRGSAGGSRSALPCPRPEWRG
jgi:hypothetical protein